MQGLREIYRANMASASERLKGMDVFLAVVEGRVFEGRRKSGHDTLWCRPCHRRLSGEVAVIGLSR